MDSLRDRVARAFIVPLGHDPVKDWARVYVGNGIDDGEDGSLRALCFALADAVIPMILEAAAKMVLEIDEDDLEHDAGEDIAAAIRALGEQTK